MQLDDQAHPLVSLSPQGEATGEWLRCQPLEGPYGRRVGRLPQPDDGEEPDEDEDDDYIDEEDDAGSQNSMSVSSRTARAGQVSHFLCPCTMYPKHR